MTEAEWLASDKLDQLVLSGADDDVDDRRWRLYACACCRLIPEFMASPPDVECLRLAELEADALPGSMEIEYPTDDEWDIRWHRRHPLTRSIAHRAITAYRDEKCALQPDIEWADTRIDEPLLALLRDIFGNPFRPVAFDGVWRTSTAVALARGMYESRDFGPMPILADALQDAGCENEEVLGHCRGGGPHVRGCWVVDLVLGKE
ncbi:Uncharacterized protein OS=Sorangium cellulosum (strain So ce56) GN=sce5710 PE=4 SV=1 [Gemmataceae bacterium]|nr:Uncharacterized protein OS=Sorangium cellulosum (strain So ce56) GN=sce5710 PE=4 SV=1 [Gemmataceae bacterium]VTT98118.1 Uncharacterized protein OS=Sorangium cellulosum (strain So ce56) GN=sce5710 PE=4 SV=1 [Gemmataceae bacterium]